MRKAEISRKTNETDITVSVNIDGGGVSDILTGIGFFDHMLTALSKHSGIDIAVKAAGDLNVDAHHTVEDTGIVLGQAFAKALAETGITNEPGWVDITKKPPIKIARYGSAFIPMDEALGFCSLDISNRPYLVFDADFNSERCGDFDCFLAEEFFRSFAFNAGITLHLKKMYGKNDHHVIEALFKALAYSLKAAVKPSDTLLSTKGVL
ncbi:MAG: imidazoleglycerol-phosphate dehydratase HisB [Ruminococcus sp.]|jgi:imidazoleglycerol-phosphate dehydratase|nr:imidazoleglycerol-phosphate dehydratase HisB [Ruminococcus sp.]